MTADELLQNAVLSENDAETTAENGNVCVIDPETREIQLPGGALLLGVESDEKVERIVFQCPKIVGDGIDLSALAIRINYKNANGEVDRLDAENIQVQGENVTFDWVLSRRVTMYKGTVSFIVCAVKLVDDAIANEWNTTIAKATVLEGIEVGYTQPEEDTMRDLLAQSLLKIDSHAQTKMDAIEQKGKDTIATIPEDYIKLEDKVDNFRSYWKIETFSGTWDRNTGILTRPSKTYQSTYKVSVGKNCYIKVYAGFDALFTIRPYLQLSELLYQGGNGEVYLEEQNTVVIYVRASDSHDLSEDDIASINITTNSEKKYVEKTKNVERFPVMTFSGSMQEKGSSNSDVYAGDYVYITAAIALPDSYTSLGKSTPVIMLCHGYTGYITNTASNQRWYPFDADTFAIARKKFLDAGYAIFDVSNTSGATGDGVFDIGNPMLVQAYKAAWELIRNYYNVEDTVQVWAMSFGSFSGVNFVMKYPSDCKSLLITGPRVSYRSMWNDQPSCHSLVAERFGFEDASQYDEEIMAQYDLYDMYEKGVPVSFPVPVKWLAGGGEYPSDSVYIGGCGNMAAHLAKYCNVSVFRVVEGFSHVDVCHLNSDGLCSEVLKWFERYGDLGSKSIVANGASNSQVSQDGGEAGEDGGYYVPGIKQTEPGVADFFWTASKPGMPTVANVKVTLPQGPAYTLTPDDTQTIVDEVIKALPNAEGVGF